MCVCVCFFSHCQWNKNSSWVHCHNDGPLIQTERCICRFHHWVSPDKSGHILIQTNMVLLNRYIIDVTWFHPCREYVFDCFWVFTSKHMWSMKMHEPHCPFMFDWGKFCGPVICQVEQAVFFQTRRGAPAFLQIMIESYRIIDVACVFPLFIFTVVTLNLYLWVSWATIPLPGFSA